MVGAAGLEPATLCLEGRCSIHLSYAPTEKIYHMTKHFAEVNTTMCEALAPSRRTTPPPYVYATISESLKGFCLILPPAPPRT
jgi:hypothetical protein